MLFFILFGRIGKKGEYYIKNLENKANTNQSLNFVRLTDILSGIAFGLIFFIAVPGLFSVILAGLAAMVSQEEFLGGEINLGVFIIAIIFALPLGFWLFYLTRQKKNSMNITISNFRRVTFLGFLVGFLPLILSTGAFLIIQQFIIFLTFQWIFPLISQIIFTGATFLYWLFFKYELTPNREGQKEILNDELSDGILLEQYAQKKSQNMTKLFFLSFLFKSLFDLFNIILFQAVQGVFILNLIQIFVIGLSIFIILSKKQKTEISQSQYLQKSIIILDFIKILLICFPILFWMVYSSSHYLFPGLGTFTYILFAIFLVCKVGCIQFLWYRKQRSTLFVPINPKLNLQIVNDTISGIVIILLFFTVYFSNTLPIILTLGLLIISITLIVEKIVLGNRSLLREILIIGSFILSDIIFCFYFLTIPWYFALPLCTFVAIVGEFFFHSQNMISTSFHTHILTGLTILLFLEIGVAVSFYTVLQSLFIFHFPLLNYIFFLTISLLASSYRVRQAYFSLNNDNFIRKIELFILICLIVIQIGIFLMILPQIFPLVDLVANFVKNLNIPTLEIQPNGLIETIFPEIQTWTSELGAVFGDFGYFFFSSDLFINLINITLSLILCFGILNGLLFFNGKGKLITHSFQTKVQFFVLLGIIGFTQFLFPLLFGNFAGVVLGLYVGSILTRLSLRRLISPFKKEDLHIIITPLRNTNIVYNHILLHFLVGAILWEIFSFPIVWTVLIVVIVGMVHFERRPIFEYIIRRSWGKMPLYLILRIGYRLLFSIWSIVAWIWAISFTGFPWFSVTTWIIFIGILLLDFFLLKKMVFFLFEFSVVAKEKRDLVRLALWITQSTLVALEISLIFFQFLNTSLLIPVFLEKPRLKVILAILVIPLYLTIRTHLTKLELDLKHNLTVMRSFKTFQLNTYFFSFLFGNLSLCLIFSTYLFLILISNFLFTLALMSIGTKFEVLYPKYAKISRLISNTLSFISTILLSLTSVWFSIEIFSVSILGSIFIGSLFTWATLQIFSLTKQIFTEKQNSLLKIGLLFLNGGLIFPILLSNRFWTFQTLSVPLQFIVINFALLYFFSMLFINSVYLRKIDLITEESHARFAFIVSHPCLLNIYFLVSGLIAQLFNLHATNPNSQIYRLGFIVIGFAPALLISLLIHLRQRSKLFKQKQIYKRVSIWETVVFWILFTLSHSLAVLLVFPSQSFLYPGILILFNFAQILTVSQLAGINENINQRKTIIIDFILMVNSALSSVVVFLLAFNLILLNVYLSLLITFLYSAIIFTTFKVFSKYLVQLLVTGINLVILNGIVLMLYLFGADVTGIFQLSIPVWIWVLVIIPLSFTYFLPSIKNIFVRLHKIGVLTGNKWRKIHFNLLTIQYFSLSILVVAIFGIEFALVPLNWQEISLNLINELLFLISTSLLVLDLYFYFGKRIKKFVDFQEYFIKYQTLFYISLFLTTLTMSFSVMCSVNFRLDIVSGLLVLLGLFFIGSVQKITFYHPQLSKSAFNVITGVKYLLGLELFLFLTSFGVLSLNLRLQTALEFGLLTFIPFLLWIPPFSRIIPRTYNWEIGGIYVLVASWWGFESLFYLYSNLFVGNLTMLWGFLLVPTFFTLISLTMLKQGRLTAKIAYHSQQILYCIFLVLGVLFINSFEYSGFPLYFNLILTVIMLVGAFIYDLAKSRWLSNPNLILVTGSLLFSFTGISISLFISAFFSQSLEQTIFVFLIPLSFFVFLGVNTSERVYSKWIDVSVVEDVAKDIYQTQNDLDSQSHQDSSVPEFVADPLEQRTELGKVDIPKLAESPSLNAELPEISDKGDASGEIPYSTSSDLHGTQTVMSVPTGFSVIEYMHKKHPQINSSLTIIANILQAYFWIRLASLNLVDWDLCLCLVVLGFLHNVKNFRQSGLQFASFYLYFILNLGFYYSLQINPQNLLAVFLIINALFLIIFQRGLTREKSSNPIFPFLENALLLYCYWVIFSILELDLSVKFLISITCFILFSRRSHIDLFFSSLFVLSLGYFLFNLFSFLSLSSHSSIILSVTFGIVGEWILCGLSEQWHKSTLKTILGFASYFVCFISLGSLSWDYFSVFRYLLPILLIFSVGYLFIFRKVEKFAHRQRFYNYNIFVQTFLALLAFGYCYLFYSLDYSFYLSTSFACGLSLFIFFYYTNLMQIPVGSRIIKTMLLASGALLSTVVFLLLIEPSLVLLPIEIALPIALDFYIFIYFIGVGLYLGEFSKEIWTKGAVGWIFVPIVNFVLIFKAVSGIDQATVSLEISQLSVNGSILLTILICSLLYLPYLLTKLNKYLDYLIIGFWIEILVFNIWGALNLFPESIYLQIPFVGLITVGVGLPYYHFKKRWSLLLVMWPIACGLNLSFFAIYFTFGLQWEIPLIAMILGIYLLIYANLSPIRVRNPTLAQILVIGSYILFLGGIYTLLYFSLKVIFIDWVVSAALAGVIISFALIPGRFFKIDTFLLKPIFSFLLSFSSGIAIWRVFDLILQVDLSLFGIFLGFAFTFALLLLFQLKNLLFNSFYQISWFFMALFFGLAAFEIFLSIFSVGVWFSTGILVFVATTICYSLINRRKAYPLLVYLLGIAFWINHVLTLFWNVAMHYPLLSFINALIVLELIFLYLGTKNSTYGVFSNPFRNHSLYLGVWTLFSALISLNFTLTLDLWLDLQWFNFIFIIVNSIAVFCLISTLLVKKSPLFENFTDINKIVHIFTQIIFIALYLINSLFIAINIPELNFYTSTQFVFFRIAVFALILYMCIVLLDRYVLKTLPERMNQQAQWGIFFFLSLCLFANSYILGQSWLFSIILLTSLNYYTLFLIHRLQTLKIHAILVIFNTLVLNACLFSFFFVTYQNTWQSSQYLYFNIFLLVASIFIIDYLMVRVKILPKEFRVPLAIQMNLLLALIITEAARLMLDQDLRTFLGIVNLVALFLFSFTILSIKLIRNNFLVVVFWGNITFAGSIGLFDSFRWVLLTTSLNPTTFDFAILYLGILASLAHMVTMGLMHNLYIFNNEDQKYHQMPQLSNLETIGVPINEISKKVIPSREKSTFEETPSLNEDSPSTSDSSPFFPISTSLSVIPRLNVILPFNQVGWLTRYRRIITIFMMGMILGLNHLWNLTYSSLILSDESSVIAGPILWLSSGLFIATLFILAENRYFANQKLRFSRYIPDTQKLVIFRLISVFTFEFFLFCHLWPLFQITQSLQALRFDWLLLDAVIVNLSLVLIFNSKYIMKIFFEPLKIIGSSLLTLYVFEIFRLYTSLSFVANLSLGIVLLSTLNLRFFKQGLFIYLYWACIANLITQFIFLGMGGLGFGFSTLTDHIISYIFFTTLLFTLILFIITHGHPKLEGDGNSLADRLVKTKILTYPQSLSYGYLDPSSRNRIFGMWLMVANIIFSGGLVYYFVDPLFSSTYIQNLGHIYTIVLLIIGGVLLLLTGFSGIWIYLISYGIFPTYQEKLVKFSLRWRYCNGYILGAFVFTVFWGIFNIQEAFTAGMYYQLFITLLISCLTIYGLIVTKVIPNYGQKLLWIIVTFWIALIPPELLRVYTESSIFLLIACFIGVIAWLNRKHAGNTLSALVIWGAYLFFLTGLLYEGISSLYSLIGFPYPWLTVLFLDCVVISIMIFSYSRHSTIDRALRKQKKLLDGMKTQPHPQFTPKDRLEILPELPYHVKIFDSLETPKYLFIGWIILCPLLVAVPIFRLYRFIMEFAIFPQYAPLNSPFSEIFVWGSILLLYIYLFDILYLYILKYSTEHQLENLVRFKAFTNLKLRIFFTVAFFLFTDLVTAAYFFILSFNFGLWIQLPFIGFGVGLISFITLGYGKFPEKLDLKEESIHRSMFFTLLLIGLSTFGLLLNLVPRWYMVIYFFAYLAVIRLSRYAQVFNYTPVFHLSLIGIYLTLVIQISYLLWIYLPQALSYALILFVVHLFIELESRIKSLKDVLPSYQLLKQISWSFFSLASLVSGFFLFYPEISELQVIVVMIIFTLELLYALYIFYPEKTERFFTLRKVILGILYMEVFCLISYELIVVNLLSQTGYADSVILTRLILITEILLVLYLLILLDHKVIKTFNTNIMDKVEPIVFLVFLLSGAGNVAYLLFFVIEIPSSTPGQTPETPPGEFNFALMQQIVGVLLVITVLVELVLYFKFKNRKVNQVLYALTTIEITLLMIGSERFILAVLALVILLIGYPFLFFLEQVVTFFRLMFKNLAKLLSIVKDRFVSFLFLCWNWIVKHLKLVLTFLGIVSAIVSFYFFRDIFISGLFFLGIFYWVSPERDQETTQKNFGKKLLYRLLIFVCIFGTTISNEIVPPEPWIFSLIILAFFGYVIWAVRKSEDIYNLAVQWRFWSSLFAILDFIVMVVLLLIKYY